MSSDDKHLRNLREAAMALRNCGGYATSADEVDAAAEYFASQSAIQTNHPFSTELKDHLWNMYILGKVSADHTAREVFDQMLDSLSQWLASRPHAAPQAGKSDVGCASGQSADSKPAVTAPMTEAAIATWHSDPLDKADPIMVAELIHALGEYESALGDLTKAAAPYLTEGMDGYVHLVWAQKMLDDGSECE